MNIIINKIKYKWNKFIFDYFIDYYEQGTRFFITYLILVFITITFPIVVAAILFYIFYDLYTMFF